MKRFLDTGVAYPKFVQPRSPGVEITALSNKELQVIQPDPELIETAPLARFDLRCPAYAKPGGQRSIT